MVSFKMKNRKYGTTSYITIDKLKIGFNDLPYIETAILFGSRASLHVHSKSDYDFALKMHDAPNSDWGMQAKAWMDICEIFKLKEYDVDVVDLQKADNLLLRNIKENYIILKGEEDDIRRLFDENLLDS